MEKEHWVLNRAQEIAEEKKSTADKSRHEVRVEAVTQALSEATGMRMPPTDVHDSVYFRQFLKETSAKTGIEILTILEFIGGGLPEK